MLRRANVITGAPDQPQKDQPQLKPMTGAQLAFRPSAPPRPGTGSQPALKPVTSTQPAFKPVSGARPAVGKTGTQQFAAFKPAEAPQPTGKDVEEEEAPVFDAERLQAQIRAMSMSDSALGRGTVKTQKPNKAPSSAAEDTFVKTKMKQAEAKVPDFDLDEDLG